jgi:hypothetical protein
MHTPPDLHGSIPTFIRITDGKVADVNLLDEIELEAGAFYVIDRGYIDFNPFSTVQLPKRGSFTKKSQASISEIYCGKWY